MKTYIITLNQSVYRRADKADFKAEIQANNLVECKEKIKTELRLNPFYVRIDGVGCDEWKF